MKSKEIIFNNRINTNVLRHKTSNLNTVWSGTDHMILDLVSLDQGTDQQLDTSTAGQETTVDFTTDGILTFLLGDKSIPIGKYQVKLAAVDSSANSTQIIHPDDDFVIFSFSATKTVT